MINKTKQLIGIALVCNINLIIAVAPTPEVMARINLATDKADAIRREIETIENTLSTISRLQDRNPWHNQLIATLGKQEKANIEAADAYKEAGLEEEAAKYTAFAVLAKGCRTEEEAMVAQRDAEIATDPAIQKDLWNSAAEKFQEAVDEYKKVKSTKRMTICAGYAVIARAVVADIEAKTNTDSTREKDLWNYAADKWQEAADEYAKLILAQNTEDGELATMKIIELESNIQRCMKFAADAKAEAAEMRVQAAEIDLERQIANTRMEIEKIEEKIEEAASTAISPIQKETLYRDLITILQTQAKVYTELAEAYKKAGSTENMERCAVIAVPIKAGIALIEAELLVTKADTKDDLIEKKDLSNCAVEKFQEAANEYKKAGSELNEEKCIAYAVGVKACLAQIEVAINPTEDSLHSVAEAWKKALDQYKKTALKLERDDIQESTNFREKANMAELNMIEYIEVIEMARAQKAQERAAAIIMTTPTDIELQMLNAADIEARKIMGKLSTAISPIQKEVLYRDLIKILKTRVKLYTELAEAYKDIERYTFFAKLAGAHITAAEAELLKTTVDMGCDLISQKNLLNCAVEKFQEAANEYKELGLKSNQARSIAYAIGTRAYVDSIEARINPTEDLWNCAAKTWEKALDQYKKTASEEDDMEESRKFRERASIAEFNMAECMKFAKEARAIKT